MSDSVIFGFSWPDLIVLFSVFVASDWIMKYGKENISTKGWGDFTVKLAGVTFILGVISYAFLGAFTVPSQNDLRGVNFYNQKYQEQRRQTARVNQLKEQELMQELSAVPEIKRDMEMHMEVVTKSDHEYKSANHDNAEILIPKDWRIGTTDSGVGVKVKPRGGALQCMLRKDYVDSNDPASMAKKFGRDATKLEYELMFKPFGIRPKMVSFSESKDDGVIYSIGFC